jgi:invasion protein IalB
MIKTLRQMGDAASLRQDAGFGTKPAIPGDLLVAAAALLHAGGAVVTGSERIHHSFFSHCTAHGCFVFFI